MKGEERGQEIRSRHCISDGSISAAKEEAESGAQLGRTASALRYRQSLVTGNGQGLGAGGGTLEARLSGPCQEAGLSVGAGFQPVGRDWKLTFKSG